MKDLLSHLAIAATTVVAVLFSFGLPRSVSSFAPHYPSRRPKTAMIPKYPWNFAHSQDSKKPRPCSPRCLVYYLLVSDSSRSDSYL
jgi:hypothetical protein